MSRSPRILAVVALSVALLATAAPAAHARILAKPHSPSLSAGSWLHASLAWAGSFFGGATPHPAAAPHSKTTTSGPLGPIGSGSGGYGGGATPMTGSGLDPNGGCLFCAPGHP